MTRRLQAALAIAYPVGIFLGVRFLGARPLAAAVGALLVLRGPALWRRVEPVERRRLLLPLVGIALLVGAAALSGDPRALLFVPSLVNAVLLLAFARSLAAPRSMIEIFARLQVGELPPEEVAYCRTLTWIWCAFFAANGLVAGWLAIAEPLEVWTLYTGLLSYLAMALLFFGEIVYRSWRFRRYAGAFSDPVMRRLFPPRPQRPPSDKP
jgi:uncharacterized membrane protein